MTNEQAFALLNGDGVDDEPNAAGNSEPKANGEAPKAGGETTPTEPKANDEGGNKTPDVVTPKKEVDNGPEPKAADDKGGENKDPKIFNQKRANHAFSKLQKKLHSKENELRELREKLKKYEGLGKENFVDELGKPDEEGWNEHRIQSGIDSNRAKDLEEQVADLRDEADEMAFGERIDEALGKDAEEFKSWMVEPVGQQGKPRVECFQDWCNSFDADSSIINRINEGVEGVRLLKHLMENKDDRAALYNAGSSRIRNKLLDKIQDKLEEGESNDGNHQPETKKQSAVDSFKEYRAKNKPTETKVKPTGSAFSGETKSGKVVRDNDYFASLL